MGEFAMAAPKNQTWLLDFMPGGSQFCLLTPNGTMFLSHMKFACKSAINTEHKYPSTLLQFSILRTGSSPPGPNDIYVASRIYRSVYPVPLSITHNNVETNCYSSSLHLSKYSLSKRYHCACSC